jgi:type VI secretion system protein ImpG
VQESLLEYYERELSILRQLGQEFARAYPKVAGRLLLEPGKCEDPHVERLIQAFAFLAARIHHKIDDEFPEIADALLGILYPHYVAPIPSMSVVEFALDPEQGKLTTGYVIPRGTQLYSRPVEGAQCKFRTCYPVTLWPVQVTSARVEPADKRIPGISAAALLRLELECRGGISFKELEIERLRFFLHGEGQVVHALYELLLNNARHIEVVCPGGPSLRRRTVLDGDGLRPVGFGLDEGMLPYPSHALPGYRLLQEYFTFPQKFLFVDLVGLDRVDRSAAGTHLEVEILLDRAPRGDLSITADNFRLGCAPIVNLFEQIAEPIRLDQTQHEHLIIPDVRRFMANEVYSVNTVTLSSPDTGAVRQVQPIYSIKHAGRDENETAFWYATRRPSIRKGDNGTEVYLSLTDLNFNPTVPAEDTLMISATCTNRDVPGKLSSDGPRGDFELEGAAPVFAIRSLVKPTPPVRPPLTGQMQWRLISHLSLNYLSLETGGPEALQEILRLYDFSDTAVVRQQIAGIAGVACKRVVRRPSGMGWQAFCRGMEIVIDFDEEKYVGTGVFLFASVLETFLGLYASLNSFTQLTARARQRERPIKRWPPRAGEQILL